MAFIDGEETSADIFGDVGAGVNSESEDGGDYFGEITDGEDYVEHNKELESHRRAANDGRIEAAEEFRDGKPRRRFRDFDQGDDCAEDEADDDCREGDLDGH